MQNETIHISSKSRLNLTFNLHQCGTNQVPPGSLLRLNPEDAFTLICVISGAALLESNDIAYKLNTSHIIFTFPDISYSIQNVSETDMKITWLSFTGYSVEHYLNRANITRTKPILGDDDNYIHSQLERIFLVSHKMPNRYCKMMSLLYDIFSHLLELNPTRERGNLADSAKIYALKAVAYIERNYFKSISIEDISTALGISRKHLFSIFNSTVKISPIKYLVYYRIEMACKRLKANTQSIAEIADSVGYSNQFYFAKEFKRLVGVSPSEYRKTQDTSEIFSYRKFVSTLHPSFDNYDIDLDMEEAVMAVYTPAIMSDNN